MRIQALGLPGSLPLLIQHWAAVHEVKRCPSRAGSACLGLA